MLHAKKPNKSIKFFFDSKFKEIVDFCSSENNDVYILYKN